MSHAAWEENAPSTAWVKSSFSTNPQGCVQVRVPREGLTEIGDTKNPGGPTLTVPHPDWDHFLTVDAGELRGPDPRGVPVG